MKLSNTIKKLKKDGYKVEYKKFGYYENIPKVNSTFLVGLIQKNNTIGINEDYRYIDTIEAIEKKFSSVGAYVDQGDHIYE